MKSVKIIEIVKLNYPLIELKFDDGKSISYNVLQIFTNKESKKKLKDINFFNQAKINHHGYELAWPDNNIELDSYNLRYYLNNKMETELIWKKTTEEKPELNQEIFGYFQWIERGNDQSFIEKVIYDGESYSYTIEANFSSSSPNLPKEKHIVKMFGEPKYWTICDNLTREAIYNLEIKEKILSLLRIK